MTQTQNYQLNQWEATDQVKRTDFNADNAKIDAAIHGLAAGKADAAAVAALQAQVAANPWVKLLSLTTTQAQSQINLNVSQFDLTQFLKLELYIAGRISKDSGTLYLRLNGLTGVYACQSSSSSSASQNEKSLIGANMSANPSGAVMALYFLGDQIMASSSSVTWSSSYIGLICRLLGAPRSTTLKPQNIHTLNLVTTDSTVLLQPGTEITVFGFKK